MRGNSSAQSGAIVFETGVEFGVWSHHAAQIELCLFEDDGNREFARLPMARDSNYTHRLFVDGLKAGARYGYRADGIYAPDNGLWYDPSKLLIDPYAKEIDRPFRYDPRLGIYGEDSQDLMPKAIVTTDTPAEIRKPLFKPGGFIYEVAVRPFTILHPDVPEAERGTVAALAHPSVIAHLKRIGVDAVELMPITAWIDERHLPPLGLTNGWGYNPVAFMALDPRLAPGGMAELRQTVAALHAEGIAVILDLVFNHTGESDRYGATLSLRGLDNLHYYRHAHSSPNELVNDTGTGNTLACDHPEVRRLIIDSLRHFVLNAGVDGFRFDLAPVLGRTATGFERDGGTLAAILADKVLADRIMIAEPWDIGPGGYQLGNFPSSFLEWNDRVRDDLRCYWRGDDWKTGALATALAGSSDIFSRNDGRQTRSVNFLAAHDGFTLTDLVSYAGKHNDANGEHNRDGHNENHSWNGGVEGETVYPTIRKRRRDDVTALISTLFATRGSIMLTAGDEGGRSQHGNNNAYCQDNEITWLDWKALDEGLVAHTAFVAGLRRRFTAFSETGLLSGNGDVEWISLSGEPMTVVEWETPSLSTLGMLLSTGDRSLRGRQTRLAVLFNRSGDRQFFTLPSGAEPGWRQLTPEGAKKIGDRATVEPRSVAFFVEN
ncbi:MULTISPECIES: glycogen debranching protein GlgX [unclassified Rhizobium]|uniref:glycogen debranching protein GlgX n=1 Tax=unclassified Rhizobium TaxID=2613769 RepID=UPI001C82B7C1|nr:MULTISPECIES: glycogen debranching protein GlgX [unclassified Rhizobium]MBX5158657.1 glycogen debranching protein GlgX [Rhizobium sp. NZLR8]MBX5163940.1 glycogen debranching protein GlgX [Rhizobium sp. NZLR4b]MBX5172034.1 glycogen debranching protein GlgX [Rhizobium sp. NZLR1b]MBX5183661.1 glycogen debranching protein GlgX [Rhizobium sp. NZLR5]MBX5191608.1 glycogen debranching protein GlgX [Rhizobium sp. NZLR3b]